MNLNVIRWLRFSVFLLVHLEQKGQFRLWQNSDKTVVSACRIQIKKPDEYFVRLFDLILIPSLIFHKVYHHATVVFGRVELLNTTHRDEDDLVFRNSHFQEFQHNSAATVL